MNQINQTLPSSLGNDVQLHPRTFRWVAVLLALWLATGASYLYRQELSMQLGLWDHFDINAVNYSRYVDSRDSQQVFQDQLLLVRQGYRKGALFVGPSNLYSRQLLPIDSNNSYRMSFELITLTDGTDDKGSATYAGVVFFDKDKNIIIEPQSHMFGVASNDVVTRATGRLQLSGVFSPNGRELNRIPPSARYMKIAINLNYGDPRAAVVLSNVKFVPYVATGDNK
ncbi:MULTISPECIES: hypothetical protein [unclassified Pseudomonas]|jgi:hypothetical protein|uniref:hypothetical protein n=1 Tax=unclassified Pseudomonas TaxID=196821 RepID=UPI000BA2F8E0|nr:MULTISPECIES: hypothetical protein [unclassified Pseudomonas]MCU1733260.1 hypothetical protein [Pseudomonas sp. 20P_3.2_Bac4]MCU1745387.1 hypothetical protein [Pseudomonas sp. 20P_3.2_Bac5]